MVNLLFVTITEEVTSQSNTAFGSERYAIITQEQHKEFMAAVNGREITHRIEQDLVGCAAFSKLFPDSMQDALADSYSLEIRPLTEAEFQAMQVVQKFFPITL